MIVPPLAQTQLAQQGVRYAPQIARAAARHGVDPALLAAVAAQETGGPGSNAGSNVVGDGGHGHGVFQIDDRWHAFARSSRAMDPASNADYAAGMLSGLLRRYGGNVGEALSAYNAGDPHARGTTTRWGDGQVLGYADSVMRHYRNIAGGIVPNIAGASAGEHPSASALESCLAERASTASSVAALAGQAMVMPMLARQLAPSNPGTASWGTARGLDPTGHSRDNHTSNADLVSDAQDDSDGEASIS